MILALALSALAAQPLTAEYQVPTADGAAVHLHRHPAQGPPVLLVHGISSNHHAWDLTPERSMAVQLQQAGMDAWLLDLRGHGDSRLDAAGHRQRSGWRVDDYGRFDLPAAIDFVRAETGYDQVGYIGHSMGGMVAAIYTALNGDDALAALAVVGSPVDFAYPDPLLDLSALSMRAGATLPQIRTPALARFAARLPHSPLRIDDLLYQRQNMDEQTRREMYRQIVSPLSRGELQQFAELLHTGVFQSDGVDYLHELSHLHVPLMAIAGRADRIAPADRVRAWVDLAQSTEKRWVVAGRANGMAADYGHLDMVVGDHAPEDIYPLLTDWMRAHPAQRAATAL